MTLQHSNEEVEWNVSETVILHGSDPDVDAGGGVGGCGAGPAWNTSGAGPARNTTGTGGVGSWEAGPACDITGGVGGRGSCGRAQDTTAFFFLFLQLSDADSELLSELAIRVFFLSKTVPQIIYGRRSPMQALAGPV